MAGSNAISVTATSGAISDAKAGEDAGNENLVGGNISLTAGSGIGGATGDADIDTAVTSINAQTTSGGIFIAETSNVTLGTVTTGSGGSSIEVIADGDMTVAQTVTTAGSGEIHLQATNSDLTVISGATVASANGKIRLAASSGALILEDASGASRRDDVYDASPTRGVIRTDNADIELAVNDLTIHDNDPDETAQIRAGGGKDIVFLPTVGRSVGLGGAAGGFQLDDSEIAALETSGRIRFSAPNKRVGEVRIDTADFSAVGGLELFSNASIGDTGAANPSAPNQLQAGTLRLDAGTGVGDGSNPLNTAVTSIDAQTTGGGIFIDEIDAVQLGNTAPVTTGSGGGAIEITAGGTMTLAQAVTTTGGGLISLTTTAGNLQVDHTGDTGITHSAAGDVTSGGTITATTTTGDIAMADGTVYNAGGDVTLTAANDVGLGRIEAGANLIRVTATTGAISDNTAAEGTGSENLVGGDTNLLAATGILKNTVFVNGAYG